MRSRFSIPTNARRPMTLGVLVVTTTLTLWACSDSVAPPAVPAAGSPASLHSGSCGVSFTAVVVNEDALLAAYGMPATTDTMLVCETWTGSDYVVEETALGSAWNAWRDADPSQTVVYESGTITGYAANGSMVHAPVDAGPTAFDYMHVDEATRQASYDDPYWAVYASGAGNCGGYQCRIEGPRGAPAPSVRVAAGTGPDTARRFMRHGLERRGVRALVEDAEEIGRSAAGHRQFRKRRGDAEVIHLVDPASGLLVGEETRSPRGTTKATHRWVRGRNGTGFVRERTEIELIETVDGQPLRSRTTIELFDVTLGGANSPAAGRSTPNPRSPR